MAASASLRATAFAQAAGFWAKAVARRDADAAIESGAAPPMRGSVAADRGPPRASARRSRA
eukprot:1328109-Lingulodinium_polyedra.AAC.1